MKLDPRSRLGPWVRAYLAQSPELVVPIKKMWNDWRAANVAPAFADFARLVLEDDAIEALPGIEYGEELNEMPPEGRVTYVKRMEGQGFYAGPRVKLRARTATREHVARMIRAQVDRMEWALRQARAAVQQAGPEPYEGQVIEMLVLAQRLREQLREAGLEPPGPPPSAGCPS